MSKAPPTQSEFAAKLIVQGSLDRLAGKAEGKFEVEGVRLSDEQRAGMGRHKGGSTIYYPVGDTGVFIDFHGAATSVWFSESDSSEALKEFEKALKKSYPKAKQQEDKPHPTDEWTRQRSYDVPLGNDRVATVDVAYPAPGSVPRGFLARILVYGRSDKKKH